LIRHIVLWNVRGDTREEKAANIAQLQRSFESLRGRIPGLLHLEIGIDCSRVDYACDVVLVSEFASQEALDAYATHPEHLRVKQEVGDMRTARHQVDYVVLPRVSLPLPPGGEGRGEGVPAPGYDYP
jgi:quinol monooxygenase YgiN